METAMTSSNAHEKTGLWDRIDAEKRRDRFVRRISVVAWSATGVILLTYAAFVGTQFARGLRMYDAGAVPVEHLVRTVMPLIAVVGSVTLLIAVLATVGVFLRMRTASLSEIQMRLASLEEVILKQKA
jgi:hypothetical protein